MNCTVDKVVPTSDGSVWYQLHSEREEITETLLKTSPLDLARPLEAWRGALLQRRLRKIDGAMDRLMTGSFGKCSKCGTPVDETKLSLDPAIEFCVDCWEKIQTQDAIDRTNAPEQFEEIGSDTCPQIIDEIDPGSEAILLRTLAPLDTICVYTRNSDYRIFLLDPKTGRALVQGGKYFGEPVEALVHGCVANSGTLTIRRIVPGMQMEFITDGGVIRTSPVQSFRIETHARLN